MATRRADLVLVEAGLFDSRAKAAEAIEAGLVRADGKPVRKASTPLAAGVRIEAGAPYPWVSRGGLKLVAGLDLFGLDPGGARCLDIGASTGGFTDVLLARGAGHVVAVDVGHDQLHPRLRGDRRVTSLEGRDARTLTIADIGRPFELLVCDASFISLRLILPSILDLAAAAAAAVLLVKPQFAAGRDRVGKGVVREPPVHEEVCRTIAAVVRDLGWAVIGLAPSPIEGRDGNREFLLGARRSRA